MAKSLMAAGVDVKLPSEDQAGGSEVKIGNEVFRAVLDTGATLSIVAGAC